MNEDTWYTCEDLILQVHLKELPSTHSLKKMKYSPMLKCTTNIDLSNTTETILILLIQPRHYHKLWLLQVLPILIPKTYGRYWSSFWISVDTANIWTDMSVFGPYWYDKTKIFGRISLSRYWPISAKTYQPYIGRFCTFCFLWFSF